MLITKIAAKNFKTYKELELDLSVIDEKPIVLIGGINNGGKTTLFDAIYYKSQIQYIFFFKLFPHQFRLNENYLLSI